VTSSIEWSGGAIKIEFDHTLFEEWAERALLHAVYGGADFGECLTTAERITDGDRTNWYDEWTETADRVAVIARESEDSGHAVSAREAYLRASNYYRTAYPFLYGAPTDERLVEAFEKETDAFRSAAALFDPPVEPVEIRTTGRRCRAISTASMIRPSRVRRSSPRTDTTRRFRS
jgi:hypothetical protein